MSCKCGRGSCAGNCAGNASKFSNPTKPFKRVKDRRGSPIRGLWKRGTKYYGRIVIKEPGKPSVDRRVGLDAGTVPEAKAELQRLRSNPPAGKEQARKETGQVPRYSDYWKCYITAVRPLKRPNTIKTEIILLRQWESVLGQVRLSDISRAMVMQFRSTRVAAGWSGRTANLSVTVLNNLLNHAKDCGLIDELATTGLKPVRWKPRKRRYFSHEEIERICEAAPGSSANGKILADYIRLMAYCGSRKRETLRIKWCDVDWPMGQLMIGADGLAKNHEFRVVDFNPQLERHLRSMSGRRGDSAYLFTAPRKNDLDVPIRCLKEALDRARNAAGIPDFTFRDCRNHFISQGVMGGIDFMTIAKWVGHKDGGILVGKVYGHLSDEHARKQAMKLMFQ